MKVLNYTAHNVLGVRDITFDLEGRHLFLVGGKNAQGKSSALKALVMALCGKRGMDDYPPITLREGQSKGWVKVQLSGDEDLHDEEGFTVELFLRRKRNGVVAEDLRVLDSTGEEAAEPRTLLKSLFALKAFDPLAFERMKPKEQMQLVKGMLGVDFEKYDSEYASKFEERRQVGIEGKKLAAQLEATPRHTDTPTIEIQVSDLMVELDRRRERNRDRGNAEQVLSHHRDKVAELDAGIEASGKEIERLKALIEKKEQEIAESERERESVEESIEALEKRLAEDPELEALDEEEIRQKIATVDETNRKVRDNAKHKELKKQVEQSRKKYQELTDRLQEINDEKAEAIRNAEWPMEGMELAEDGILLNGLPLEQGSKRERIIASAKVGMMLNPKLRLLVCEHGGDLDEEGLDVLEEILVEYDFQMLLELVTRGKDDEERCAVVIHDGSVVGEEDAEDEEEDEEPEDE